VAYLREKGIHLDKPLPPNAEIPAYWRACLDDLYQNYGGTCAYLAVFFERVTGGASVDHFIAKSDRADLAYEWSNYRLACSTMNSRKWTYDDVLDPFEVLEGWFHVELVSGRIYANPGLPEPTRKRIDHTIKRLRLDDYGNREMRARHYQEYRENFYNAEFLRKRSPFVWYEAERQGLL
jgi:hypothetical protein